ncbi:MAG: polysaccharide biosynthesis tyrosine autokinase [Acidobacteriota bacterium]|nr:polysaccharide biosynthesis tyrosine autokinase [Acidobacteriota bacterium]
MKSSTRKAARGLGTETPPAGRVGERLRDSGKLTDRDIDRILVAQTRGRRRFGETAVDLKLVTEGEIQMALSQQYNYPHFQSQDFGWSSDVFSAREPFGAQSEAIRTLRSDLVLRGYGDEKKILAVVGSRAGDGTSILAANLAVSFAQLGERTLLIDANLRKPSQRFLFGLADGSGLSDVLRSRCALNEAITQMHPVDNLSILTSGPAPPNPQELLSQMGFSYLIETGTLAFDIAIIDTPPMMEFADAQVISRRAGACVCVCRRNRTSVADIAQVKSLLERSGVQAVGAVVWD